MERRRFKEITLSVLKFSAVSVAENLTQTAFQSAIENAHILEIYHTLSETIIALLN
jgi:hypothetical protein